MNRSQFLKNKPRPNKSSSLAGRYIRKHDDILLIPKYIDVYDIYLNETTGQVTIRYEDDRGDKAEKDLNYLTNFCRTEKEKRHAKYF
jgi:hypothetical protein